LNLNDPLQIYSGKRPSSVNVERHCDYLRNPNLVLATWSNEARLALTKLNSYKDEINLSGKNDKSIEHIAASLNLLIQSRKGHLIPFVEDFHVRISACERWGHGVTSVMLGLEREVTAKVAEIREAKRSYEGIALLDGVPILDQIEGALSEPVRLAHAKVALKEAELRGLCDRHRVHGELWLERINRLMSLKVDLPDLAPRLDDKTKADWVGPRLKSLLGTGQLWSSQESISPADVKQTQIGDCYFAVVMADLANTPSGRAFLQSLITDNFDGTYTVYFPGLGKSFTVDADVYVGKEGNYLTGVPGTHGNFWYLIIQKAWAAHNAESGGGWEKTEGVRGLQELEVFNALGLRGTTIGVADIDVAGLDAILSKAPDLPATVGIRFANFTGNPNSTGSHAFSVLEYDYHSGSPRVKLRNPWGTDSGNIPGTERLTNGEFWISVQILKEQANSVSFAGTTP